MCNRFSSVDVRECLWSSYNASLLAALFVLRKTRFRIASNLNAAEIFVLFWPKEQQKKY